MFGKTAYYATLAEDAAHQVTGSKERWTSFLATSARLYKYPYHEQLLIHAQRPDATACAEYDFWNDKMHRYIKRGSKGIALLDNSGDKPRLRYVFDVSDTGERRISRPVQLWKLEDDYREPVQKALETAYGISAEHGLETQIEEVAKVLATEYWNEHGKQFLDIIDDSYLEGYDKFNIEVAFRNAVTVSTTYALYTRCVDNPDDYFEHEDFLDIFDFNTRQTANALGTAVSGISSQVFREIEVTIRNCERSKQAERSQNYDERNDIQPGRGLSDSEHRIEPDRNEAPGQVRENEENLPAGEQSDVVQRPDSQREAVPSPVGDRRDSEPENGIVDEAVPGTEPGTGQSNTADGVGAAHGNIESTSRGDSDDGAYQQLNMFFIPSEGEQISIIDEAESSLLPAFSFAQKEIDHVLQLGSNEDNGRKIVVADYMKEKPLGEIAETLKQVYRGGFGIKDDDRNIAAWYAEDGIHLAKGNTAQYVSNAQIIPWEDAAKRIGELLETGEYATNVELVEAPGFERTKLAESLWYLYHDFSEEAREKGFFFTLESLETRGFPDQTAELASKLQDAEFLSALKEEYRNFLEAHAENRSLLRFHYHKLGNIEKRLNEIDMPVREYQTEWSMMPIYRQFITDDEINKALAGGSGFSRGKQRISEYWEGSHSTKEKADFLKQEYGIGGRSHALSFATGSSEEHDAKGIKYEKRGCDDVGFTWSQVASRIETLIRKDRYLSEEDKQRITSLGRAKELIRDFCMDEYESVPEFNNLSEIGIAYTTITDDEIPIQVNVNLESFRVERYLDDVLIETRQYASLEELIDIELDNLNFEDLISYTDADLELLQNERETESAPEIIADTQETETAEQETAVANEEIESENSTEQEPSHWHYSVGNTVYLDDTAFLIEQVGTFDVQLRDPSLVYPIFRAENKERFEQMLGRDERNNGFNDTLEPVPVAADKIPALNFHIEDAELGTGGPKEKFGRNIEAIRTLFALEAENRNATPEEQQILSNYVGWGGLADAFDDDKSSWSQEYATLKGLLSDDEYVAARASTLNAHYTSPTVIQAIYDGVQQMGFETGNILEPAMGVGNFFGMLPPEMRNSRLYGVELDAITGRIAQKLYPNAEIKVAGFETTDRRDFYDLAVGNVPFGNYKVSDKPYDKLNFSIHNYFFAKSLDQVRPGGVVAFVTSRYTMDSKNSDARRYMAQRAELLGAIRLPNDAFKKNAGTDVVSDIIFLQKRDHPIDIVPDWVNQNTTEDGYTMNSYFVDQPEMIMGNLAMQSTPYGKDELTVLPREGEPLAEQLKTAINHIQGSYTAVELPEADTLGIQPKTIPADPNVKNFSYTVVDGDVYFRENSIMRQVELNDKAKERVIGMVGLRQIVGELIDYQMEDYPDDMIKAKQAELNAAYDAFSAKNGLINARANGQAFSDDSSYYLLCSLENIDEDGNLESKADMFTKRTIKPERRVTSVDTPSEALAISIGEHGKVDLPFMATLLGKPEEYDTITAELRGVIFKDPMAPNGYESGWLTADDYLSGDVRSKLLIAEMAARQNPDYAVNVEALQKAQPKDLDASEIDVRLGATWIDPDYIQQFMEETFEPPYYLRRNIEIKFSDITAEWRINGKSSPNHNDVAAYVTYGTDRANAYRILEETLNLKDIRIYDTIEDADGKQKRVLNKKETTLAQQKQQAIKDAFRDWIWKEPHRREALVVKYNELFNSTRPREYDGSHIRFSGMNPDISLREHQKNAIAHVLYGGNTLLAHEVGAGKTFEMAASAMESKRLGLSQKSLFVVPNHLTMQWANEFLHLYPSAKLLVATKKDFETANRKKFCARIATGDYDAVIIGHSQFEKIPISPERQERLLQAQIDEIENALVDLKFQRGENFTIKQMEKTRKSLQTRMDKLMAEERKDDVITFEQLGVDRLFVDESHAFKNLFLYTKMRNVAGLSTSEAQKSSDMFMKCRYMDELTGGRGVIFATGTPVSNSMTELYTVMRYLQYGTLQKKGLTHFDCWASTFGETNTAIELAPEGTGYRARTRFAKFFNLPELMNMFKEVADIKTSDQLNLPVPEAKFETVVVQPSEHQQEMVSDLSERAAAVHSGNVDPTEDNMLKITSDGRKLGLDQRLMNPLLPDDPESKLNACVGNVLRIWQDGQENKLTQLLFCDLSTPKNDGTFNVYDDIRTKLLTAGIPETEVAFIHDADTETKKKELFAKVRTGQVRVLLGSTQKMGAGTNVQDRLVAVHHLDVGWRPSDMTQRNGRIIRQGNKNKEVQIYQYVTEGTFDAYLYQTLENKQKFISQIMTSKSPVRSCDDVDEQALSYAEIKALCAGNPLIKEKMDLDIEVARLKVLKADHQSQQYRMEDKLLKYFPAEIEKTTGFIHGFEADIQTVAAHPQITDSFCGMELNGKHYAEKADAGEILLAMCKEMKSTEPITVGNYRGFQMELSFESFSREFNITLKGAMSHRVALGTDARGNVTRLDNALSGVPDRLETAKEQLENLCNQQEATKGEIGKPFPQEAELTEKCMRLAELDAALNMEDTVESRSEKGGSDRSSVLADLKAKADHVVPFRRSEGREEVL